MKTIIFGATGFIGKQLVPLLQKRGHSLVLVGRKKEQLSIMFPECTVASYSSFETHATAAETAINLATVNSTSKESIATYNKVNNDLVIELAKRCKSIGVKRFLNLTSIHVLDPRNNSNYARSKRKGAESLAALKLENYMNLYLPNVYGKTWSGRFSFLNRFPTAIANYMFGLMRSLTPTLHIEKLARAIAGSVEELKTPIILCDSKEDEQFYSFTRRAIDVVFALATLFLFWWLLIAIWAAIKLESDGPGIFSQKRIGKQRREFVCYKFRTMQLGTVERGTHEISTSNVTRLGKLLRKYKLDELPQIVNLLRNEMSLIGPRPCLPTQTELISERSKLGVFNIKPGISGYAQVRGIDMSQPTVLANADYRYIGLRGLFLDIKIALDTAIGRGNGDKTQL